MARKINSNEHVAWNLRVLMSTTAAGTAKLTLDALLAGYYTQAAALTRHLFETWKVMVYARLTPEAARQWFSPDGERDPQPPSMGTIARGIRNRAKQVGESETLQNLTVIELRISGLDEGAHPSPMALSQPFTDRPGHLQLGGTRLKNQWLRAGMNASLSAIGLIVIETSKLFPDVSHREEIAEVWEAASQIWPVRQSDG